MKALIEKAKQAGGAMWAAEAHFFCEAPRANSATDPVIVPTKIFDNVYAIGNSGTTVYVVQTSDGLLMIDSLGAAQVDTLLLPGFQKLGLDPAQVKIIIAGHGHADHVGGSRYMQVLTPGIISDEGLQTYLKSVAHFKEETTKAKVDVEIQNHPLMDPIQVKLDKLAARRQGDPNPFVVGQENYRKFLDVMSLCTQVNIARRNPI